MSLLSAISHFAHEYRDARARYLTEREVSSLPLEVRKDIGWPSEMAPRCQTTNPVWLKH